MDRRILEKMYSYSKERKRYIETRLVGNYFTTVTLTA